MSKYGDIDRYSVLDDHGLLIEPIFDDAPSYDFKLMRNYCKENNKKMNQLTQAEIELFKSDCLHEIFD